MGSLALALVVAVAAAAFAFPFRFHGGGDRSVFLDELNVFFGEDVLDFMGECVCVCVCVFGA